MKRGKKLRANLERRTNSYNQIRDDKKTARKCPGSMSGRKS